MSDTGVLNAEDGLSVNVSGAKRITFCRKLTD